MTTKELKQIISNLSDETILLIDGEEDRNEVGSINVEYHSDGRVHLIFSVFE